MRPGDDSDDFLVTVFRTQDLGLLSVVRSLLESAGVPHEVQGGHSLEILPLSPAAGFFRPSALAVAVRVRSEDAVEVRDLLARTVPSGWESD
jgi:hypothetical protein